MPLTLRELVWACEAKERGEWDRVTPLLATVRSFLTGKRIHPDRLNPYRQQRAKAPRRGPVTEEESAKAWELIDLAFLGPEGMRKERACG